MERPPVHYPHRIGYRLDDETWIKLEKVIRGTAFSPHDWCRLAALERLNTEFGLTRNERFLFEQIARTQYLVGLGFQMLADDRLIAEDWKKLRVFATEKIEVISARVLTEVQSRTDDNGSQTLPYKT
jgi:hypothetical protein